MEQKKKVRLSDIAKELNISTVTVSKAISNKEGVGDELRKQIKELAESMGYKTKKECAEDMELSLTLNLEGISSAFDLIDFKKNTNHIGKIVYIGLKEKQQLILKGQGKDNE
jgi:Mn-dependent DtxR family transcriptional regulator